MPVTLAQKPPSIAFSKNPLWLTLQSDDYQPAQPVAAVNYILFTNAVAANDQEGLYWNGGGVLMTAANAPDNSGTQYPPGDGSFAYVQSLVSYFQGNYLIDANFIVTADNSGDSPRLLFTARNPEADLNFNVNNNIGNLTPGTDNAALPNFAHHLEVWIDNTAGGFDKAYDANVPLDQPLTGATTIDISGVLDSWLTQPGQLDMPELQKPYSQYTATLRAWYIKYAQIYGSVPAVQKVTTSATSFIALGGLSMQNALLRDIVDELCPTGDPGNNRFMRQGSINKLITKEQPEWLTFINLTDTAIRLIMQVFVYNTDGSTLTFTTSASQALPYQKYQFQTGYMQLDIDSNLNQGQTALYYTVQAKTVGGASLSQPYGYVIDTLYREFPRYFVYLNSYGAFQTIATVGKGQDEYDRTKTDAQLSLDRGTAAIQGDFLETNIRIQDKGTVNQGYDRAGRRNTMLLRDLMLSKQIYLYSDGTLIPVGLNTDNLKDAMDGNNVYANSFEWFARYQEEVWTEPLGLPDDDLIDLGGWPECGHRAAGLPYRCK